MASIKPITIPTKTLSESITASATSFKLSDIKGWDDSDLTSADFGSKAYAVFRNAANTKMEIVQFDPTTIASTGIDFVYRGLKFDGELDTEVSANKLSWTKGDTFVDLGTAVPQLLQHCVKIVGSEQIVEQLQYSTELTPTDAKDITTKGYVDSVLSGGTVTNNKLIVAGDAGETVATGDLVYYDDTDNEWKKTDANTATTVNEVLLGIAQGAGTDGNPISGGVLIRGLDETQTGMTVGVKLYASDTAGEIAESSGTTEKIIGFSKSATELYFDPYFGAFLTAKEKDALAGAGATPSSSNKFLTEGDVDDNTLLPPPQVVTFTTTGTWTKDAGLKYVVVEVQGAGGKGASSAGGGAGAWSRKKIDASSLGSTETVTVGTASLGSGNTSFGSHITCGNGGNGSTDTGGSGGTATGGDVNIDGQDGQAGYQNAGGGAGGSSILGVGGPFTPPSSSTAATAGVAGSGYGAGGAGNSDASDGDPDATGDGGAGTAGIVIVTEYYS